MGWMLLPLKRYSDFHGRSRRREFWMFMLVYIIMSAPLIALNPILGVSGVGKASGLGALVYWLHFALIAFLFIPNLAVQARRFHDIGWSGWCVLLNFIPYVGVFIVLVFMVFDGKRGPNRYGPDPKDQGYNTVFE